MRQVLMTLTVCAILCSGCQSLSKNQLKHFSIPADALGTEKVWVEAKTRKIWVNAHVDDNGDMVDGHYKYLVVAPGHWAVKGE